jgi:hypothetical protein
MCLIGNEKVTNNKGALLCTHRLKYTLLFRKVALSERDLIKNYA